jgi:hypothetical protein
LAHIPATEQLPRRTRPRRLSNPPSHLRAHWQVRRLPPGIFPTSPTAYSFNCPHFQLRPPTSLSKTIGSMA